MTPAGDEAAPLRAEHDALASRLPARRSIDLVRRGAWGGFLLLVTGGLAAKLAWDRWASTHPRAFKGTPVFFYLALLAALACLVVSAASFARARRLMRDEDRDFQRLRELRRRLGLDA